MGQCAEILHSAGRRLSAGCSAAGRVEGSRIYAGNTPRPWMLRKGQGRRFIRQVPIQALETPSSIRGRRTKQLRHGQKHACFVMASRHVRILLYEQQFPEEKNSSQSTPQTCSWDQRDQTLLSCDAKQEKSYRGRREKTRGLTGR